MSTTSDLKTAMVYARSSKSVLMRLQTNSFMNRGPDISWVSCFPMEREFLFPPLTYLRPMSDPISGKTITEIVPVEELEASYHVVDVEPTFS